MLPLKSLVAIALAVSALAVPSASSVDALRKRDLELGGYTVTFHLPTGQDDVGYEATVDNGTSWSGNAQTSELTLSANLTGYRVKEKPETAFLARIPRPGPHVDFLSYWISNDDSHRFPFGLHNTNGDLYTDYSKSPVERVVPGTWIDIPVSADVSISNDGHCDGVPDPFTTTVYYKDPSIPPQVFKGNSSIFAPPLQFHIENFLIVKNITVDFEEEAIYPPVQPPYRVKYASAEGAPLISGHINLFGGFCEIDD